MLQWLTDIAPLVYLVLGLWSSARLIAWDAHDNTIIYARGNRLAARYGVHRVQRAESKLIFLSAWLAAVAVLVALASSWWAVGVAHVAGFGLASAASLWGDWYFQRTINWCFGIPFPEPGEEAGTDSGDPRRRWPKPFYGTGHWRGREHQRLAAVVVGVVSAVGYGWVNGWIA